MLERDLDRAADLFEEAFRAMVEVGDTQSAGNALGNWGQVEFLRGDLDAAGGLLSDGLRRLRQTDDRYSILHTMITAGALFAARGDTMRAATVLGRVEALQREMDIAINPSELRLLDETLAELRAGVPAEELELSLAEGRGLDHDAALDMLLAALDT
jgi:ATP/maltotriose-dependent transcriptional regulator MalT